MRFKDLKIGDRFLYRENSGTFFSWQKVEPSRAVRTTPLGQNYGEPQWFATDAMVTPE
jgi:hypothetical protein